MASKRQTRATVAPLLAILGVTALLYGFIAVKGWDYAPKLGLDLRGGTSVILQPKAVTGGAKPSSGSINKAVDIIRLRVNQFGVAESEVRREGDNIVISIPGGDQQQIAAASKTAQLRFRMVLDAAPGAPTVAPAPSDSGSPSTTPSSSPAGSASSSGSPSASGSSAPAAPSASPSPTPSTSATTNPRPLTSGLRAQAATPTASPLASGSPSVAASGTPTASDTAAASGTAS
ncbi:MAG: preprotein translocase subunit SecD, partial [Frankiaceae bacterium]|nr:preprotein translocase subunit SecD [Frankiaceae bacterium]